MAESTKRLKHLARETAVVAHEAELRQALRPLAEAFGQWERREIDSFDLNDLIHRFHQGPARDLYLRYTSGFNEMAIASAIVSGALARDAVPAELLDHICPEIRLIEESRNADSDA
jgi:hypothetical protein